MYVADCWGIELNLLLLHLSTTQCFFTVFRFGFLHSIFRVVLVQWKIKSKFDIWFETLVIKFEELNINLYWSPRMLLLLGIDLGLGDTLNV